MLHQKTPKSSSFNGPKLIKRAQENVVLHTFKVQVIIQEPKIKAIWDHVLYKPQLGVKSP